MGHPVVHSEVIGKDPGRLQDYYTELFGWDVDADDPLDYGYVTREGNVRADGVRPGQQRDAGGDGERVEQAAPVAVSARTQSHEPQQHQR